jgi:hypothetical protein
LVCCLKGMWVHPYHITPTKLAPDFGIEVHLWSENDAITSCLRLISTSDHFSHIHFWHIKSVWANGMLSQGNIGAPPYTVTPATSTPNLGILGRLWSVKWCHYVSVKADIHLRLIPTSLLDMNRVFQLLLCCLKGIWVHFHTITPARLAPDLWSQGHLWSDNDFITSWLRLTSTSDPFIHPYYAYTKSVWAIGMLSEGHVGAPLYHYTGQVGPRIGDSGSLEEWKW